jgi:phospholipase C
LARLLLPALVAACLALGPIGAAAKPKPPPPFSRVVVLVMENKDYGQVIGSADAPYTGSLARSYALATGYYGVRHPSLPNYLALVGGSTFGITNDCTDCTVHGPSLVDELERRRISWRAYMEGMPSPCFGGATAGGYAKKHDPFLYFDGVAGNPQRCAKVVPMTRLDGDLRARRLPRFVWITPDLCHDTHDCDVRTGDRFLAGLVPRLLRALGQRGVLFLTWDEGVGAAGCCGHPGGGRVPTIVAGPAARRGARSGVPFDHYSLLRTIEDGFGLRRLGASASARPLTPLLRSG